MSEKTPNLLDVPKDRPTRKERLEAFKIKHGIWTHNAGPSLGILPWCAVLVPNARRSLKGYSVPAAAHPIDLIAGYGRLLEEWSLMVEGPTEHETISHLCTINRILFNP